MGVGGGEMEGSNCREEGLVIRAAEMCGRDVWEANKQGGGGRVGGGCWEVIKKLNGHKFLNEFGVSGEKTISSLGRSPVMESHRRRRRSVIGAGQG